MKQVEKEGSVGLAVLVIVEFGVEEEKRGERRMPGLGGGN